MQVHKDAIVNNLSVTDAAKFKTIEVEDQVTAPLVVADVSETNVTMTKNLLVGVVSNVSPSPPTGGGVRFQYSRTFTDGPHILTDEDHTILVQTGASDKTILLPEDPLLGQRYFIKKIDFALGELLIEGGTIDIVDKYNLGVPTTSYSLPHTLSGSTATVFSVEIMFIGGAWHIL